MMDVSIEKLCDALYGCQAGIHVVPAEIPCKERSDVNCLCERPLVSVRLVAYNHESYIRQSIESVLMQETGFEFELVIGEDCSQDKTRDICFEYQKRYPGKVRVLWAHENVNNKGGNGARTAYHCRGKYIALLEGDDYWTDPYKLQKQVDLIRKTGAIGCVANYATEHKDGTRSESVYCPPSGFLTHADLARCYPHTSTYVFRRDFIENRVKLFPNIRAWYDVVQLHCLVATGKVAYLSDVVSVYRITGDGIATSLSGQKKQLLAVKQYLDLYLHGPKSWHKRFGAAVMTYVAFFFNRSTPGWTREFTESKSKLLRQIFWEIYRKQLFDLRSLRAFLRYVRFRLGLKK